MSLLEKLRTVFQRQSVFDRYTDRARLAVQTANVIANRIEGRSISNHHILMGILHTAPGMGTEAIRFTHQDLNPIQLAMHPTEIDTVSRQSDVHLPLDPAAWEMIARAKSESTFLGDDYVGTEHLAISITNEFDSPSSKILAVFDITADVLRHNTLILQARAFDAPSNFLRARAKYELALKLFPASITAKNDFAWLLCTCTDASIRDGARAVTLATEACGLCDPPEASCLDTLAAAYAEIGNYKEAVAWGTRAVNIAPPDRHGDCIERVKLFRQEMPFREYIRAANKQRILM